MPLIEPVATCRKFNVLKRPAQWFYLQLKTCTDPLGRTDGHPRVINSTLFPLRTDVRDTDISHWLHECEQAGLLRCYTDKRGRSVVQVHDAVQRLSPKNMKSDFDPPDGQPDMFPEHEPQKTFCPPNKNGSEEKGKSAPKRDTENPLPPISSEKAKKPELWQLLNDETRLTDRIKAELQKQTPDRELIEILKKQRASIRDKIKTL